MAPKKAKSIGALTVKWLSDDVSFFVTRAVNISKTPQTINPTIKSLKKLTVSHLY